MFTISRIPSALLLPLDRTMTLIQRQDQLPSLSSAAPATHGPPTIPPILSGPVKYLVEGLIDGCAGVTLVVRVVTVNDGRDEPTEDEEDGDDEDQAHMLSVVVTVTILVIERATVEVCMIIESRVVIAVELSDGVAAAAEVSVGVLDVFTVLKSVASKVVVSVIVLYIVTVVILLTAFPPDPITKCGSKLICAGGSRAGHATPDEIDCQPPTRTGRCRESIVKKMRRAPRQTMLKIKAA
jgi:hypothetical protein